MARMHAFTFFSKQKKKGARAKQGKKIDLLFVC
jgi:hypothetical protein